MSKKIPKLRFLKYVYLFFLIIFFVISCVFISDAILNYIKITYTSPRYLKVNDVVLSNDALEFRVIPPEYYKQVSGKGDILLYGDSWTFGFGVPYGYSFSELIRDSFKNKFSVKIAGKNGSDLTRQFIAIKNTEPKPRLSIIFFNLGNDYEGSMMQSDFWSTEDYVMFNEQQSDIVIMPKDDSLLGVFKYSADFDYLNKYIVQRNLLGNRINNVLFRFGLIEEFLYNTYYYQQHFYSMNGGWKYVIHHDDPQIQKCADNGYNLLDIIFRDINKHLDGQVIVVLLPPREVFGMDIYRRMYDVTAAKRGIAHSNLDYNQPRNKLISILRKNGIKYIDVYPMMEKAMLDGKNVFINYNDHPNWLGHKVIFEAVVKEIEAFAQKQKTF